MKGGGKGAVTMGGVRCVGRLPRRRKSRAYKVHAPDGDNGKGSRRQGEQQPVDETPITRPLSEDEEGSVRAEDGDEDRGDRHSWVGRPWHVA